MNQSEWDAKKADLLIAAFSAFESEINHLDTQTHSRFNLFLVIVTAVAVAFAAAGGHVPDSGVLYDIGDGISLGLLLIGLMAYSWQTNSGIAHINLARRARKIVQIFNQGPPGMTNYELTEQTGPVDEDYSGYRMHLGIIPPRSFFRSISAQICLINAGLSFATAILFARGHLPVQQRTNEGLLVLVGLVAAVVVVGLQLLYRGRVGRTAMREARGDPPGTPGLRWAMARIWLTAAWQRNVGQEEWSALPGVSTPDHRSRSRAPT